MFFFSIKLMNLFGRRKTPLSWLCFFVQMWGFIMFLWDIPLSKERFVLMTISHISKIFNNKVNITALTLVTLHINRKALIVSSAVGVIILLPCVQMTHDFVSGSLSDSLKFLLPYFNESLSFLQVFTKSSGVFCANVGCLWECLHVSRIMLVLKLKGLYVPWYF